MKVLNVLTGKFQADGISNILLNYYRNISSSDIHIDFVASSVIDSIENIVKSKGGKVYLIEYRKKKPLKYMKELTKIIKEGKYDIVHAHGSSALLCLEMIAAKKAGCNIRIAHSHNTKANHKIIDKILRPIFYKNYTHGFACGEEAGKWLFGNRKFEVINNGKSIEEFEYNEEIRKQMRQENHISNEVVIGHVGRINMQKNQEYLIDIFFELNKRNRGKYKLILVGDGPLEESIKEKVKKLNLEKEVIFVGRTFEVNKWLQVMDIMVFPSRFEGFPNVLVEWQIAGLPCIISDTITKDVKLTDLVQFASIQDKPEKWAEKIEKIKIEDRQENKSMIIEQIREKGFDIKENAQKLENIYMELYKGVN